MNSEVIITCVKPVKVKHKRSDRECQTMFAERNLLSKFLLSELGRYRGGRHQLQHKP